MIALNTPRYSDKIRTIDDFELPSSNSRRLALQEKEIEMVLALAMLKAIADSFNPANHRATCREDVLAQMQRKIKAKQARLITFPEAERDQPAASKPAARKAASHEPARKTRDCA